MIYTWEQFRESLNFVGISLIITVSFMRLKSQCDSCRARWYETIFWAFDLSILVWVFECPGLFMSSQTAPLICVLVLEHTAAQVGQRHRSRPQGWLWMSACLCRWRDGPVACPKCLSASHQIGFRPPRRWKERISWKRVWINGEWCSKKFASFCSCVGVSLSKVLKTFTVT